MTAPRAPPRDRGQGNRIKISHVEAHDAEQEVVVPSCHVSAILDACLDLGALLEEPQRELTHSAEIGCGVARSDAAVVFAERDIEGRKYFKWPAGGSVGGLGGLEAGLSWPGWRACVT